ncbi:hypothetical protein FDB72_02865 [Clostridium botulinum]|uniref:hypothetical protein n=1 Tax=Clostridium botulinum TaxID=1491 RepID=UPI0001F852FB|nr:hypothetical protein [Clostridium botulinum]KEI91288.1 membrane protein [Clostridium botulinum B2 275]MCJ8171428.1 hypothetical protein [Clostridium botulinum]NFB17677.1 hypothetical protein [Clostridium botulinum]NFB67900.1 hypothetical protein [Clostridium botulinum]NFB98501.1 hypothetical protein [Clostridium botulinum]
MKVVLNFIIFMILIIYVEKIIEKTNIHVALINRIKKYKHYKKFLFIALMIVWFTVEVGKQSLNVRFGKHNILSIILGAIILGIYLEFLPYIFSKKHI